MNNNETTSYINYMQDKINSSAPGTVFTVSDFTDVMSSDTARQMLLRLSKEGRIRRILPGIYDKPEYSEILQSNVAPDTNATAEAIARKNNWLIFPSENVAANLLGLSTQVPARWEYVSSGPSKEYQVGNLSIIFTHRANRETIKMSPRTVLLIQALKALGQEGITDDVRFQLGQKYSTQEKELILREARVTTDWIYQEIKEIFNDVSESI